jgi:hypothetical protein
MKLRWFKSMDIGRIDRNVGLLQIDIFQRLDADCCIKGTENNLS